MELPNQERIEIEHRAVKKVLDKILLQGKSEELIKKMLEAGKSYEEIRKALDELFERGF